MHRSNTRDCIDANIVKRAMEIAVLVSNWFIIKYGERREQTVHNSYLETKMGSNGRAHFKFGLEQLFRMISADEYQCFIKHLRREYGEQVSMPQYGNEIKLPTEGNTEIFPEDVEVPVCKFFDLLLEALIECSEQIETDPLRIDTEAVRNHERLRAQARLPVGA